MYEQCLCMKRQVPPFSWEGPGSTQIAWSVHSANPSLPLGTWSLKLEEEEERKGEGEGEGEEKGKKGMDEESKRKLRGHKKFELALPHN